MNLKVGAIVEARMTSSRLPGKHLLTVANKPIIGHLIHRLQSISSIDQVIIAMTLRPEDDPLDDYVRSIGASVFRGDEDDVMGRVLAAAYSFSIDVVCEVTGDCPIIDISFTDQLIRSFLCNNVDYANNTKFGGLPDGMGCQVFSTNTLAKSESLTQQPLDREHVTLHIKRHPDLFRPLFLVPESRFCWPDLAITLDEYSDYILLKRIIEYFGPSEPLFTCLDVIDLLRRFPDWIEINKHVVRKGES